MGPKKKLPRENKYLRIKKEKQKVAEQFFGGKCYICHKHKRVGFLFHHLRYNDGEKIYSDFPSTIEYHEYLLPIVRTDPTRFMLLCVKCHYALEKNKRYKKDVFDRLIKAVELSRY